MEERQSSRPFYWVTIKRIPSGYITVWNGACRSDSSYSKKVTGSLFSPVRKFPFPYVPLLLPKAPHPSIAGDPTRLSHSLLRLLRLRARSSWLKDSFIHQAVRKLRVPAAADLWPPTTVHTRKQKIWTLDLTPMQPRFTMISLMSSNPLLYQVNPVSTCLVLH